jgi:hypothetical protein
VPLVEQQLLNFQSTYVHPAVTGQVPLVEQQLLVTALQVAPVLLYRGMNVCALEIK